MKTLIKLFFSPLVIIIISYYYIILAFQVGIHSGLDHIVPDAVDTQNRAIALAISRDVYGDRKYIGHRIVLDTLINNGVTQLEAPIKTLGLIYPDNIKNRILINSAIDKAINLGELKKGNFWERTLITGEYDDLGLVDYSYIAFKIFGYQIESLYYLFFLIISLSCGFYAISFYKNNYALILLPCYTISIYLIISSSNFQQIDLGTVSNQRFLSVLAILPFIQIGYELLSQRKFNLIYLISFMMQVSILFFAIFIRQSAYWTVVAIILLIFFIIARKWNDKFGIKTNLKLIISWPIYGFFLALFSFHLYQNIALSPVYSFDDFIPHRMQWHSAYLGLAVNPKWEEKFGSAHSNTGGDGIAWTASQNYLKEVGQVGDQANNYFLAQLSSSYKFGLHEKVIKIAYINFALSNPKYFIETILFYKPKKFINILYDYEKKQLTLIYKNLINLLSFSYLLLYVFLNKPNIIDPVKNNIEEGGILLKIILLSLLGSLVPIIWGFPAIHVVSEQIIIYSTVILIFLLFIPKIIKP